jgi:SAM-dependent methyltransferase
MLIRTSPRPTPETIGYYYPDDYAPHQPPGTSPKAKRGAIRRLLHALPIETLATAIPPLPPGRFLEVGCGAGTFLAAMKERGWEVEGIELNRVAAERAAAGGLRVHSGALENVDVPDGSFDLITAWMTIEHLHDPLEALERLKRWSKPGGWLAISVPDAGAAEFRWFGPHWYALQVPTHLFHFTSASLVRIIEVAGWRTRKLMYQRSVANLIGSLGNVLEDRGKGRLGRSLRTFPDAPGRLGYLIHPAAVVASLFRQSGRMTLWAQKET